MTNETRKIMHLPDLPISATCVRVPVMVAHAEAAHIEFEHSISPGEAREVLDAAPGITVLDDPASSVYPMPVDAEGKDDVFVGRIRQDVSTTNGIALWLVSDNLRKGAADQRDSDRRGGVATGPSARQNLKPNPYPMAQCRLHDKGETTGHSPSFPRKREFRSLDNAQDSQTIRKLH